MAKSIRVSKILLEESVSARAALSKRMIQDFADAMRGGAKFPPIVVFREGGNYWIGDGFMRVAAAAHNRTRLIKADVRDGTWHDAMVYACGANARDGLRRLPEDKRRAVLLLLGDDICRTWTNDMIARHCDVSPDMVYELRGGDIEAPSMADDDRAEPRFDELDEDGGDAFTDAGAYDADLDVPEVAGDADSDDEAEADPAVDLLAAGEPDLLGGDPALAEPADSPSEERGADENSEVDETDEAPAADAVEDEGAAAAAADEEEASADDEDAGVEEEAADATDGDAKNAAAADATDAADAEDERDTDRVPPKPAETPPRTAPPKPRAAAPQKPPASRPVPPPGKPRPPSPPAKAPPPRRPAAEAAGSRAPSSQHAASPNGATAGGPGIHPAAVDLTRRLIETLATTSLTPMDFVEGIHAKDRDAVGRHISAVSQWLTTAIGLLWLQKSFEPASDADSDGRRDD